MRDFSDFHKVVREMMEDFGTTGMYYTQLEGEYDPSIGEAEVIVGEIPIMGILMDLTLQSNGQGTKDGTLIRDGDKLLYVKPTEELLPILMPEGVLTIDPSDDRVELGGVMYKIVTSKTVDPEATGTLPILIELYVRK